jgi:hypothetical protein
MGVFTGRPLQTITYLFDMNMQQPQQQLANSQGEEKRPEPIPWSTQIKDWAQIIAIVFGGGWALYVYCHRDWPALAQRQKAESKVTWKHPQKNMIHAEYYVTMTNGGSKAFTIVRAHLRVWTLTKSVAFAKDSGFLDVNRFIRNGSDLKNGGELIVDTNFTNGSKKDTLGPPFCQEYAPGALWPENFDIPLILDTTKLALFLMQFYQETEPMLLDWTYDWGVIGGDSLCSKEPLNQCRDSQHPKK